VDDRATEDECEHRGCGDAAAAHGRGVRLMTCALNRAADDHPLPRPERLRFVRWARRGLAEFLRQAAIAILTLAAPIYMRDDLRRLGRLHVIRFEKIGFVVMLFHR